MHFPMTVDRHERQHSDHCDGDQPSDEETARLIIVNIDTSVCSRYQKKDHKKIQYIQILLGRMHKNTRHQKAEKDIQSCVENKKKAHGSLTFTHFAG